jgi:three-Cys-motif partner protein
MLLTGRFDMAKTATHQGHRFGGAWTEVKLDAVKYYLGFFTKVLASQPSPTRPFELWYIDAFAGSGSRQIEMVTGGLLENEPVGEETVDMAGSVLHALDVSPPFRRLVFIEGHGGRFRSLEAIRNANPSRGIECKQGDANARLQEIFSSPPWSKQSQGRGSHRAVCFLDPYGMSVDWGTLKLLAETRAVDVWYLFPLDAVTRQLATNLDRVDVHKQKRLDAMFGTPDWREDLYKVETGADLFAEPISTTTRTVTKAQIEEYARQRIGTLFRYVSEPLPLLAEGRGQIFSLFCLSNSASDKAIGLIRKGVAGVLKNYGPASRHRSARARSGP